MWNILKSFNEQSCLNCAHRLYMTKHCLFKQDDVNLSKSCSSWKLHSPVTDVEKLWARHEGIYRSYGIKYDPNRGFVKVYGI